MNRESYRKKMMDQYRAVFGYECQVSEIMGLGKQPGREVHHIFGRSTANWKTDWFCNLCWVSIGCHRTGHDFNPNHLEIACLLSAVRHKQQARALGMPPIGEDMMRWNLQAMNVNCGCIDLAGRVGGILIDRVAGDSKYVRYCEEILEFIDLSKD